MIKKFNRFSSIGVVYLFFVFAILKKVFLYFPLFLKYIDKLRFSQAKIFIPIFL